MSQDSIVFYRTPVLVTSAGTPSASLGDTLWSFMTLTTLFFAL